MPIKAGFSTKGFESYLEDIQQAGKDIDAAAARALQAGAGVLLPVMVELVPKDEHDLERSLVIDGPHQDGNRIYIDVGLIDAPKEIAIYGGVQEYGSPSKHIQAQSYIRAAWDRMKSKVSKAIRGSLKAEGMVDS